MPKGPSMHQQTQSNFRGASTLTLIQWILRWMCQQPNWPQQWDDLPTLSMNSDHYAEENIPVERPRITPIPAPVAIPFIRLLRIQGIRSKFSLSRSCRPILLLGQHWGPYFIQLRIEARTLKASTRSCQKLPVVSRWKMGGLSEDVRVSDGCFEDWVSVGWEFDMTVGVQDLRYFAHISSRASLSSKILAGSEKSIQRVYILFKVYKSNKYLVWIGLVWRLILWALYLCSINTQTHAHSDAHYARLQLTTEPAGPCCVGVGSSSSGFW